MVGLRLLQFLALVALILAPVGMAGGHAAAMAVPDMPAMHHVAAMSPDHCVGMDEPAKPQPPSCIDCNMVCAGLPAAEILVAAHPLAAAPRLYTPLEDAVRSLHPESEPPPPRIA